MKKSIFIVICLAAGLSLVSCNGQNTDRLLTDSQMKRWVKTVDPRENPGAWGLAASPYAVLEFNLEDFTYQQWFCSNQDEFIQQEDSAVFKGKWSVDGNVIHVSIETTNDSYVNEEWTIKRISKEKLDIHFFNRKNEYVGTHQYVPYKKN